jgi:hypothetical protein
MTVASPFRLEFQRQHQMDIAHLQLEDCPGDVILMQTLHDDHDRRPLLVVEAVQRAFPEFSGGVGALDSGFPRYQPNAGRR